MSSVSGLNADQRLRARERVVQAAMLGIQKRAAIHYTQGSRRWDGIRLHKNARRGEYPSYGDCSSFATWCIWNGLVLSGFTRRDTVNGTNWTGGFTGTMLTHGKRVYHFENLLRGDCIIYGNGGSGKHTAICVGRRRDGTMMVASFGNEAGPLYVPYNYRSDIMQARRYI